MSAILVTHDQEEALSMADRVGVLNNGSLEQLAALNDGALQAQVHAE